VGVKSKTTEFLPCYWKFRFGSAKKLGKNVVIMRKFCRQFYNYKGRTLYFINCKVTAFLEIHVVLQHFSFALFNVNSALMTVQKNGTTTHLNEKKKSAAIFPNFSWLFLMVVSDRTPAHRRVCKYLSQQLWYSDVLPRFIHAHHTTSVNYLSRPVSLLFGLMKTLISLPLWQYTIPNMATYNIATTRFKWRPLREQ